MQVEQRPRHQLCHSAALVGQLDRAGGEWSLKRSLDQCHRLVGETRPQQAEQVVVVRISGVGIKEADDVAVGLL